MATITQTMNLAGANRVSGASKASASAGPIARAVRTPVARSSAFLGASIRPARTVAVNRSAYTAGRFTVFAAEGLDDKSVVQLGGREDFDKVIAEAGDKLVVVDISTTTCGPCKMIYPKIVKMADTYTDAVFCKINGDKDAETVALMREWSIRAVPAFHFYKNGELVHDHTGAKIDVLKGHFKTHYNGSIPVDA